MENQPPAPNSPEPLKNPRYTRKVPFSFRVISAADEGALEGGETAEGETHDISAGGLRFRSDQPLEAGARLELNLRLSPSFEPTIGATVLRWDSLEDTSGNVFKVVAVQFTQLDPQVHVQLRDFLTPKFSFQKGSEEEQQEKTEASGQPSKDPSTVDWSSEGVKAPEPRPGQAKSKEES